MSIQPNIDRYVPLNMAVSMALDEMKKSDGDQDECWIQGLRCLLLLNQQVSAEPKTVRIPRNANFTFTIPGGYIGWSKIGILNTEGEVVTLKINNSLTTWRDTNPNRLSLLTPDINNSIGTLAPAPLYLNYYYNNGYFNLFGIGNGLIQYGNVRVDLDNHLVIAPPDFQYDHIIFEGITNPERDTDYMILSSFVEPVIAFIKWKQKVGSREEFYAAATEMRRTLPGKKVTLQGINQVIRESESMKLRG